MFISGHFANWEAMPVMATQLGYEADLSIARQAILTSTASSRACAPVQVRGFRFRRARGHTRIFTLLRRGQCIIMLVDQKTSVSVPFWPRSPDDAGAGGTGAQTQHRCPSMSGSEAHGFGCISGRRSSLRRPASRRRRARTDGKDQRTWKRAYARVAMALDIAAGRPRVTRRRIDKAKSRPVGRQRRGRTSRAASNQLRPQWVRSVARLHPTIHLVTAFDCVAALPWPVLVNVDCRHAVAMISDVPPVGKSARQAKPYHLQA